MGSFIGNREHKGGIYAYLRWLKWLLGLALISSVLRSLFYVSLLFTDEPVRIEVAKRQPVKGQDLGHIQLELTRGVATLHDTKWFDGLLFGHTENGNLLASLLWAVISWLLIRILNDLNFKDGPFSMAVAQRIKGIGLALLAFCILDLLRHGLAAYRLHGLVDGYKFIAAQSGYSSNVFILSLVVMLIAYVFRIACLYQEENRLTI